MALTKISTDGVKDDAVTLAKQAGGTDGQIITYDASGNPVAVGPGTDGQVLTSTGAGSPPAFEDVPAGGISDVVSDTSPQLGGDLQSNGNDIDFADNDKAAFGASNDLTLSHNGSDTYITSNTGNLIIQHTNNSGDFEIKANDFRVKSYANEEYIRAQADGTVELYHDGTKQCETSANGLAFPSGKGIDFGATGDGGGSSNVSELLSDFETGTFSLGGPVIGGGSFTASVGRYTRIGNVCHVFVSASSFSTSGQNYDLQLSGLPFTSSSTQTSMALVSTNKPGMSNGIKAHIPANNTIMAIRSQWADDGLKSQDFNGYGIDFNATYIVG